MLANKYKNQCINGWLVSEKFDGIRAVFFDGDFYSRNGLHFKAPKSFTDLLPKNIILDGELWLGRGMLQEMAGIARSHHGDWSQVKFAIFDIVEGGKFIERYKHLLRIALPDHSFVVKQSKVKSNVELQMINDGILSNAGEGVIVRSPTARYSIGRRTNSMLKVKREDTAEAFLLRTEKGKGKNAGRVGTFVCKWNDQEIRLGAGIPDALREMPPAIGESLTFAFSGMTKGGAPREARFTAVRNYE